MTYRLTLKARIPWRRSDTFTWTCEKLIPARGSASEAVAYAEEGLRRRGYKNIRCHEEDSEIHVYGENLD